MSKKRMYQRIYKYVAQLSQLDRATRYNFVNWCTTVRKIHFEKSMRNGAIR